MAGALEGLIVVAACGLLIYGPWQWVCTEVGRQLVFEFRAKIFDLARQGQLNFDSPEYKTIRRSLNQTIRFAHELTWQRFIIVNWQITKWKRMGKNEKSELQKAIERIENPQIRQDVSRLMLRAYLSLIIMVFIKSPVLLLGAPAYIGLAVCVHFIKKIRDWAKCIILETGEMVQREAEIFVPIEADYRRSR